MNINLGTGAGALLRGRLHGAGNGLKSSEEKQERQTKRQSQIDFWEKQKENLRGMKCDTPEEIAEKLALYHSYEDGIAAARLAYNNEQMWHTMDEAREQGEKIAEAAEKTKPKTAEERKEALRAEARDTDDCEGEGLTEKMMDAVNETVGAEAADETVEETAADLSKEASFVPPEKDSIRHFDYFA